MTREGHVALITGAGRNVGRAITLELTGGGSDVLVNDAAIRPQRRFLDLSEAEWRRVVDVDLDAACFTPAAAT